MAHDIALNLFWLLLPVAAASGWYAARRRYAEQNDGARPTTLAPDYFKGLTYLLNEQPDKAIKVFIRLLDVESDTVEIHFAVGNLFRRRGEVDRAIQIHQNLIAKPTLEQAQRCSAMYELALDYMRSGWLDRAEELFQKLLDLGSHRAKALKQLLDIYQREQDWEKAIQCAKQTQEIFGKDMSVYIAQYYCEKADNLIASGEPSSEVMQLVNEALAVDPRCVRASLLEAALLRQDGQIKAAVKAYERVEQQDPGFVSEAIYPLMECYRELDDLDGFTRYLERLSQQDLGIKPTLLLAQLLAEKHDNAAAIDYLGGELGKKPSMRGLEQMMSYVKDGLEGQAKEHLEVIKELTQKLIERNNSYRCRHCGYSANSVHWQCPGCGYWLTIKHTQRHRPHRT